MRSVVIFAAILLIATVVGIYTSAMWSQWVLLGQTFHSTHWWWSPLQLLNLLDEFVLLLLAGTFLGLLASLRRPWLWGLALGAAFSFIRLSLSHNWFSPDADFVAYLWAYSEYYLSPIGAVLGVLVGGKFRAWRRQRVVA